VSAPWEVPEIGQQGGHPDYPIVWQRKVCRNPKPNHLPKGCGRLYEGWVWLKKPFLTPQVQDTLDGELRWVGLCDRCVRKSEADMARRMKPTDEQRERQAIEQAELEPPQRARYP
jgi:hypothetical protein